VLDVSGDQSRIVNAPLMSLRGEVSPRGDRTYVGDSQELLLTFDVPDIPTAFSVALDHVPTDAIAKSQIKVRDWLPGGHSYLAVINEVHDADHVWTRTQVWFMSHHRGRGAESPHHLRR